MCPLCQSRKRDDKRASVPADQVVVSTVCFLSISSMGNYSWWKLIYNTQIFIFYVPSHVSIPPLLPQNFSPDLPAFFFPGDDHLASPLANTCVSIYAALGHWSFHKKTDKCSAKAPPIEISVLATPECIWGASAIYFWLELMNTTIN